jgi:hypothetical protein
MSGYLLAPQETREQAMEVVDPRLVVRRVTAPCVEPRADAALNALDDRLVLALHLIEVPASALTEPGGIPEVGGDAQDPGQ